MDPLNELLRAATPVPLGETGDRVGADTTTAPPPDPAAVTAGQAAAIDAAVAEYVAMLPAIRAAQPLPPTAEQRTELVGADRIVDGCRRCLAALNLAAFGVEIRSDAVVARAIIPLHQVRDAWRPFLVEVLETRGNVGMFEAFDDTEDDCGIYLVRRGVTGPGAAWRAAGPKAARFFADRAAQRHVFDLCKLFQTRKSDGARRYPTVHALGEDDRGGTVELRLPPGMVLGKVVAAEAALRQVFCAPDLVVDSAGVHPLIRLNSREMVHEFPTQNPLSASALWRPRNPAERAASSDDVRLFLGVTADGTVIAPKLRERSHAAIYGMTNSGKSTLLTIIARSLAAQGVEVWLADAKGTPEFLSLFRENNPGITHLSVSIPALMYGTVHKLRELYRFRAAVTNALTARGIEDVHWPRTVLIFDELGEFLNTRLSDGSPKIERKQAEVCVNMLSEIGAKARAYGVHFIVAGQHVYAAALPSKLKEHISIRAVLGRVSDTHIQRLFDEQDRDAARASREGIEPGAKGRGIVMADDGRVVQFQSFYNSPARAARFARGAAGTHRLRRWGHRFPADNDPASLGEWHKWGAWEGDASFTPTGTVEDIGTVVLDRRTVTGGLESDPTAGVWDPASAAWNPGEPPRSAAFENVN